MTTTTNKRTGARARAVQQVHFDRTVRVYNTISLSDMTSSEMGSSFLSSNDQIRILSEVKRSVRAIMTTKDNGAGNNEQGQEVQVQQEEDVTHYCARGLEHLRSPSHLERRRIERECNVRAVLAEQDRQRGLPAEEVTNEMDVESLAEASRKTSQRARRLALSAGASDAAYVYKQNKMMALPSQPMKGNAIQRALDLLGGEKTPASSRGTGAQTKPAATTQLHLRCFPNAAVAPPSPAMGRFDCQSPLSPTVSGAKKTDMKNKAGGGAARLPLTSLAATDSSVHV